MPMQPYPAPRTLVAIVGLLLALGPCALSRHRATHAGSARSHALWQLQGCSTYPVTRGCSEDTAEYLARRYRPGDRVILTALLDAGRHCDGALAEPLGCFYADVLDREPSAFVSALESQADGEQRALAQ